MKDTQRVSVETLREALAELLRRGTLVPAGENANGEPLFKLGDPVLSGGADLEDSDHG